jgi:hypothetical protein
MWDAMMRAIVILLVNSLKLRAWSGKSRHSIARRRRGRLAAAAAGWRSQRHPRAGLDDRRSEREPADRQAAVRPLEDQVGVVGVVLDLHTRDAALDDGGRDRRAVGGRD